VTIPYAIGLDIARDELSKSAGVTPAGQALFRETFETRSQAPDWPERVKAQLAELERTRGTAKWVGVAATGVARADGTSSAGCAPAGGGAGVELGRISSAARVPVLNDAQAALLGEVSQGRPRERPNAILLTLGTGVGGAAMVDGRLLRGHLGRAGHLGHICLDPHGQPDIVRTPGVLRR